MNSGLLDGGENSGTLDNVLGSSAGPVDVGGIPLTKDNDLGAVDVKEGAVVLYFSCKSEDELVLDSSASIIIASKFSEQRVYEEIRSL